MYLYSLMIYSRALTDSEIASIYNNPDSSITSGLVLWLKADPAYIQGNTWLDLSGNGNNATLYNAQLIQLAPSIPWLWVGIGVAVAVALGAGLYVAYKKGLI